jgi:hypothetical protein
MISPRRNWTCGVRAKCAIRIVGFVEVQKDLTFSRRFRVDVTAPVISLFSGSLVTEHHKKLVAADKRLQSERLIHNQLKNNGRSVIAIYCLKAFFNLSQESIVFLPPFLDFR